MAKSRKARKSPTPAANKEFPPALTQFFARMREFDDRLRPFIGKPLVEGTDEYNQYQAVLQERSHFANEWMTKHARAERIDTPARLLELIEQRQVTLGMIPLAYGGGFPAEAAGEYYGEAFGLALDIAKSNPALPSLPERVSDPQIGLDNLRRWCITALPTDLISTSVVLKDYHVSRHTLYRAVKHGTIQNCRPPNVAKNTPYLLRRAEIARNWPKK